VSTVIKSHIPIVSAGAPDDDPTGVRALLSSLPEPDPMPEHLVERINASLAAEQSHRAARTSRSSVTPLLTTGRRRPARLLFAIAGTAAAVVLVATVASNMFMVNHPAAITGHAALASTSSSPEAAGGAPPEASNRSAAGLAATPPSIQIRLSGTRYTRADFVTQARTLRGATLDPLRPTAVASSEVGPAGTGPGLIECLSAIGATGAQMVRADVAFYEGQPAVIIVTTTNGIPMAYAVGRRCSHADAAVLRPATALP
jgi:hypothetical protein